MKATPSLSPRMSAFSLAIITLLLVMPHHLSPAHAADEGARFPDTAIGRIAEEWFHAFNSGDADVMGRFHLDHDSEALLERMDEKRRRSMYLGVYGQTGRLTPESILGEAPDGIDILCRSEGGGWLEVEFGFDEETGKITAIMLKPSAPPSEQPPEGPMSEKEALDGIAAKLAESTRNDEFSGAVLIAKDGKEIFAEPFGMASREFSVPNRIDTKFNLGSINKIFTKTAVAMLLSQGKLSLEDRIGDHLPDYPNREAAEKVTVRHLVEMTSGIGDFFGERYIATPKSRLRTLEDYLPLFASEQLAFEPGTGELYSNGGFVVLGLIVASASGEDYYDYVRRNIFEPAGMTDTDSYEADEIVENLACGYTRTGFEGEEGDLRANIYTRPARGSSAGGGYSTASDLMKFVDAIMTNVLLPAEYSAWIFGGPEPGKGQESDRARRLGGIALAGGAPGINSYLDIGTPGDYTIIVMTNLDPPAAMQAGSLIRSWLDNIE